MSDQLLQKICWGKVCRTKIFRQCLENSGK